MKRCITENLPLLIALLIIVSISVSAEDSKVFYIPRIEGITVDGSGDDWGRHGFRVEFLADPDGRVLPIDDFDVKFRLGWNQQGLLVLATVRDDVPLEHESLSRLWRKDCVEIFLSKYVGSSNRHQVVIASGADSKYKTVRQKIYDWRHQRDKTSKLTAQSRSQILEKGYIIEALLPWENLGVEPSIGIELGFQFVANDYDGDSEDSSSSLRVAWFHGLDPGQRLNMYKMSLSEKPSRPVLFRVYRKISFGEYTVSVKGSGELIGESVALRTKNETVSQGELETKGGRASIQFSLDSKKFADEWPQIDVVIAEDTAASFEALHTLDWILDRYIYTLGGRAAIEKLTTRVCTGRFVNDLSLTDPPLQTHPLKAYAKIPDKWVMILQVSRGTEQNGFDGTVGWTQNPDRIERNNGMSRSWLGYILNPQGALRMLDYFPGMTLEAKDTLRGNAVYVVKTSSQSRTKNRLYFDAKTGLLTQIGLAWELQNYREVDGIKFPFRIATSRKGGETYFAFDKIEHNTPIGDARFAVPRAEDVYADAFQGIEDSKVLQMLQCKDLTYVHEDMNVPCRDGRFLYDFIIKNNYERGLEIGTFTGYSALWMGLAFQKTGGQIITIEIDKGYGQIAQENIQKAGLEDVIDSRINDAFKEIPNIEGKFDFVFIDAWKPDYIKFLRLLKDRILPGGAIIAHNVTNHARDMREFLDAIKNDVNLETTFYEIGAEGMSISIVRK
ncbi:MAG: class I SAM-dependent methyltransferase [Candidatus Aminicenantes bacterium]|nr:MAG: class I SAM-dependent methyltransferase [Candidatus Aminicenantes bacterium]